ncbi:MAG: tyrosine-type recombinase/integrase [Planctomycetota bacterium]
MRSGVVIGSQVPVRKLASQWLDSYVKAKRLPGDQRKAAARVRLYLLPFLGERPIARVTRENLWAYRVWLETHPISPQTVKHILSDARCFFRWAEDAGYVGRSPFPKRLQPKLQEKPPDRLTEVEIAALEKLPEPYGFAIRFLLATGLRWGELVRARRDHVENGMLVVSQTKSRRVRRVPLSPEIQRELHVQVGKLVPFEDSGTFNRHVRKLSGVDRFHVHQARHTFACQWLERGGSLASLQQMLGHASVVTTQRYARLSDEHVKLEAERLAGKVAAKVAAAKMQRVDSL